MRIVRDAHKVKCRKQHICDFCNKKILVGEFCDSSTLEDGGELKEWRTCTRCKDFVEEAFNNKEYNFEDGMSSNEFIDYMENEHPDILKVWVADDKVLNNKGGN